MHPKNKLTNEGNRIGTRFLVPPPDIVPSPTPPLALMLRIGRLNPSHPIANGESYPEVCPTSIATRRIADDFIFRSVLLEER
jgi:hypothetical protein